MEHKENCILCGAKLVYLDTPKEMECIYCHKKVMSQVSCENGHFICDECHSESGLHHIMEVCLESHETDPMVLARQLFQDSRIYMHGPEHHVLVPAVLTAVYLNKIGQPELKQSYLALALDRGSKVPGGSCGFSGCCGAGVGVGIFFSIICKTTPLDETLWGQVNRATGQALLNIGKYDGPRCCKRNTFIAFETADAILKETQGITLMEHAPICGWFPHNEECLKETCAYYPKRDRQ